MSSAFSVSRRLVGTACVVGDVCVVEVRGELDVITVDAFRACTSAALRSSRAVVVDLGGTTLLDCAGFSALLAAQREARRAGVPLTVTGVHGLVQLVFDAFGVDGTLGGGDPEEEVHRVGASTGPGEPSPTPSRVKARAR